MGISGKIKGDISEYRARKKSEIMALLFFALAVLIFISLVTFDYNDLSFFTSSVNKPIKNFAGMFGAYLGCLLLVVMGFSAYVIPVLVVLWAISRLAGNKPENYYLKLFGALFLILASSSTLSLVTGHDNGLSFRMGGIVGTSFSKFLANYMGIVGAGVAIIVLLLLSLLVATDFFIFPFITMFLKNISVKIKNLRDKAVERQKPVKLHKAEPKTLFKDNKPKVAQPPKPAVTKKLATGEPQPEVDLRDNKQTAQAAKPEKPKETAGEAKASVKPEPRKEQKPYVLPDLALLNSPPPPEEREIKDDLTENSRILEEILKDFDIEAKVIEANRGPVITRYELEPGSGVKVNKVTSLSDNIALAMKAQSIRIVAPVPGKGTIGVEIPNSKGVMVYLKEILETEEYKNEESKLKLALGKDIAGEPVIADLAGMPHLLIAGATGSGKTVCMNSIITSILFNATPDEVRFIMVDPKKVELAPYNNLPHLLCPVLTDYKKVPVALDWLVQEMERRYELFASSGVRNIFYYNKKAEQEQWAHLYYIVVIIDELADLMMVSQQEIESTITRLAQLSRAVGIHMILATQRPSVDVITGVIKANFPARISFKVASKVDSRTVLDMNGADKLLGRGDMLLVEPGSDKPVRAQGGLVFDEEIERVAEYIRTQRPPDYIEEISRMPKKGPGGGARFQRDEIYDQAVKIVLETKQASVSMVQRKLGVGYTKAARLIDMMEEEGIVGPYQGSKPREILVEDAGTKEEEENING